MSTTQTTIKGHIVNPDLPIITPDGPQSSYFVDFCTKLGLYGYEMSPEQKAATAAFIDAVVAEGLTKYISCVYPFIGSAQRKSAAGVPIFGGKDLALTDQYAGLSVSGDEVLGIRITPDRSIKFSELSPDQNLIGVAASVNKLSTVGVSEYSNGLFAFTGSTFNFRLQKTAAGEYFRLYYPQEISTNITLIGTIDGIKAAGTFYCLGIYKNPAGYVWRVRHGESSGGIANELVNYHKPQFTQANMNATMQSGTAPTYISEVSSFTFFKDLMNNEQAEKYIDLLKAYMTALGRESA